MQNVAKMLVIEDDASRRHELNVILKFIGEPSITCASFEVNHALCNKIETGFFIGHICASNRANVIAQLSCFQHIPLICFAEMKNEFRHLPQYVGDLTLPLNYRKLSEALRYCHEFTGRSVSNRLHFHKNNTLFRSLVGCSEKISYVRQMIERVSMTEASVLILGQSGTGKEVVARNIHYYSRRGNGPFVPVNCGAIPPELLESELFGHEKGAFTGAVSARKGRFEMAEGGTLFLDEIGDMPANMQVKLLRVLQERCFERVGSNRTIQANVRIIAATHCDLESMIAKNQFRADLFYRLNVFPIEMPALCERMEDIPLLIQELMTRLEAETGFRIELTPVAVSALMTYQWPGNVRELANLIERLLILYPDQTVELEDLPPQYRSQAFSNIERSLSNALTQTKELASLEPLIESNHQIGSEFDGGIVLPAEGVNLKAMLADVEVDMIRKALDVQHGVVARAADMLGMRRTTLVEKMRKYGLSK